MEHVISVECTLGEGDRRVLGPVIERVAGEIGMRIARCVVLELNLARLGGRFADSNGSLNYCDFIEGIRDGSLHPHFKTKYPALWERETSRVRNALGNGMLALERFEEDRGALREAGLVDDAYVAFSVEQTGDTHLGHATCIIRSSDMRAILYKPRSGASELLLQSLVEMLAEYKVHLPVAKVVDFGTHHWQEFVTAAGPNTPPPASCRQLGELLALAYGAGFTDLHHENVIMSSAGPVVVDAECGPAPVPTGWMSNIDAAAALEDVGILPFRVGSGGDGYKANWGVIGYREEFSMPFEVHVAEADGTDEVRLIRQSPEVPPTDQRAEAGRWSQDRTRAFLEGFSEVAETLSSARERIVSELVAQNPRTRIVLRATQRYMDLLRKTSYPEFALSPRRTRDQLVEQLQFAGEGRFDALVRYELSELEQGSIPRFDAAISDTSIAFGSYEVSATPKLEGLVARLRSLGNEAEVVRLSNLALRRLGAEFGESVLVGARPRRTRKVTVQDAMHEIAGDAGNLARAPEWENLALGEDGRFHVTSSILDLYGGSTGTALALAVANRALGFDDPRIDAVVASVSEAAFDLLRDPNVTHPVGLFNGVSGAAYFAACQLNIGADRPERQQAILNLALSLALDLVDSASDTDIVSGAAGVLGLAGNLRRSKLGDPATLLAIEERALGVLARAARHSRDLAFWPEQHGERLGGFSHGVAGIAWALSRSRGAESLARSAWAAQLSLFDDDSLEWVDLRSGTNAPTAAFHAWCHGSDGIILASADGRGLDVPTARDALISTWLARCDPPPSPTLCHGRAGRLSALLALSSRRAGPLPLLRAEVEKYRSLVLDDLTSAGSSGHAFQLSNGLFLGRSGSLLAITLADAPASMDLPFPLLASVGRPNL